MDVDMAMDNISRLMGLSILANGRMINEMGMVIRLILLVIDILEVGMMIISKG